MVTTPLRLWEGLLKNKSIVTEKPLMWQCCLSAPKYPQFTQLYLLSLTKMTFIHWFIHSFFTHSFILLGPIHWLPSIGFKIPQESHQKPAWLLCTLWSVGSEPVPFTKILPYPTSVITAHPTCSPAAPEPGLALLSRVSNVQGAAAGLQRFHPGWTLLRLPENPCPAPEPAACCLLLQKSAQPPAWTLTKLA